MSRVLLWVVMGLAFPSTGWAFDAWPQWRGPHRDGVSTEKGLLDRWDRPPPLLWKADGFGIGYSGVAVAGGLVCTMGDRKGKTVVTAVSEQNGEKIWVAMLDDFLPQYDLPGSRSTPTIDTGFMYAASPTGVLACLRTADGAFIWKRDYRYDFQGRPSSRGYTESPLVDGGKVIVSPGGPEAGVVALDKRTGEEIWRCTLTSHKKRKWKTLEISYSSPVVSWGAGVKQYIKHFGGGLVGIHAETGRQLWNYGGVDTFDDTIATPVVYGDYVFASCSYGGGSAVVKLSAAADGGVAAKEVYHYPPQKLQINHGSAVLVDGYLYLGHGGHDSFPKCVDFLTGKFAWPDVRGPGAGSATVSYADGHLYLVYANGVVALVAATPKKYRVKGQFRLPCATRQCWAQPAISNGRLYVREHDMLYCYDLRKHR